MILQNYKTDTVRQFFIKIYLFFIPIVSLLNSLELRYAKVLLISFIFFIVVTSPGFKARNKFKFFFVLFIFGCMIFVIRKQNIHFFFIIINYINFYFIFIYKTINFEQKIKYFHHFIWGIVASVTIGITYMYITGIFVKGGAYTINYFNISNLDLPVLLSIMIIYYYFFRIEERKNINIFVYIILIFITVSFLVFLDKRLPILTVFLSILYVKLKIENKKINLLFLLIVVIYPIYATVIFLYLQPIFESNLFLLIFERSGDLLDLGNNPRVVRIIAGAIMLQDITFINLLYYPNELLTFITPPHNHFHNLLIQLYYDRGFVTVLSLFILSIISINITQFHRETKVSLAVIINCFLIGTSESLMPESIIQFILISFVIINYGLSKSSAKYL